MLLVEAKVYVVGYRKSDNDQWRTSGKTWGDLTDAQWNAKELAKHASCTTQVFEMGKMLPVD